MSFKYGGGSGVRCKAPARESRVQHWRALTGHAPSTAGWSAGLAGAGRSGYGHSGHHGGGHDGASAADVLGELRTLRTLLGPLVATTSHVPVLQARAPHPPAPHPSAARARPEQPEWPPPGAGLLAGDDELLRLADSEEAWW